MMLQLIKKNLLIIPMYFYMILIGCMVFLYFAGLPASSVLIVFYLPIIIVPFIVDRISHVHHYLLSLPIRKNHIVFSRYLFSIIAACTYILLLWLFMWIFSFTGRELYMFNWKDIIVLFSIVCLIISYTLPALYIQHMLAFLSIFVVYLISTFYMIGALVNVLNITEGFDFAELDAGFGLLAETYIPIAPFSLVVIGTTLILLISFKLSTFLFNWKNMVM